MSLSGDRIRELRLRNGMTLDDVAKHLGINRQAVYKYEQGIVTNIPLDKIEKMSELFCVSPGYISGWSDDPPPEPDRPKTDDIRLLIRGLNKLTPSQIEQATNVFRAMFEKTNPDLFKGDDDK